MPVRDVFALVFLPLLRNSASALVDFVLMFINIFDSLVKISLYNM